MTKTNPSTSVPSDGNSGPVLSTPVRPSRFFDLTIICLLVYGVGLLLRIWELPAWQASFYQIDGEKLMATHDAYYWLAGAQGTARTLGTGFMEFMKVLGALFPLPLGNIGFFLPVILAPLAGLPICYLAWKENMPEAGLGAGLLGVSCMGFFLRTRLGFCDTDPFAIIFPTIVGVALILWSIPVMRPFSFGKTQSTHAGLSAQNFFRTTTGATFAGIAVGSVSLLGFWLYPQNKILTLTMIMLGLTCCLVRGSSRNRLPSTWFFLALYAVGYGSWIGLSAILAGLIVRHLLLRFGKEDAYGWAILAAVALICLVHTDFHKILWAIMTRIMVYAKPAIFDSAGNGTELQLPAVMQSIREAQNVNMSLLYSRIAGNAFLFWAGLAAYGYLIWKRPVYLILLPFLGLSLAAAKLGNRFTMYGGVAWGVALCFGLSTFLSSWSLSTRKKWIAQILLTLVIAWPAWQVATACRPGPILPQVYAQTFKDLREQTEPDARLWQWWDYGYAAQYYAGRMSFADGGIHDGPWLYPLALVHCTDSPRQAAQMIAYTTSSQQENFATNTTLQHISSRSLKWTAPFYLTDPVQSLEMMTPPEAQTFVDSLRRETFQFTPDLPTQYLVVSWENLRLAYWISYFGNWDLVTGSASPGKTQRLRGQIQFNTKKGLITSDRQTIPLDTLDIISNSAPRHMTWPNGKGLHGIFNRLSSEVYVMDTTIYRSMMIQMLISPPEQFEPFFALTVDNYPWARAYKVKAAQ
jgi:dolichyl-diphosphooligosaccharide--protein glycosyltransferase